MSWYVLTTKPQQELRAENNLKSQGFEIYLPLIDFHKINRGKKVIKQEPLFFRYLFIQLNAGSDNLANIRYTRGVSDFIRFGDQFGVVSDKLIEHLKVRCDSSGSIRSTLPKKGERVEIIEGPYKHLNAIYDCPDGDQRSFVLVNLLQNMVKLPLSNMEFKKVS